MNLYSKDPEKACSRIHDILQALDVITSPEQMRFPGLDFHPLKGGLKGHDAIKVNANWRITFSFDGKNLILVGYIDDH